MKLFLLPYAGGNMYAFKGLEREFPSSVSLAPLELPGRGRRFGQQLITQPAAAIDDILFQMKDSLHSPYAIFGHSMGAVLGFLVTKKIIESKLNGPSHLFCSGRSGLRNESLQWHSLPSNEFWQRISDLGGLPEGSFFNAEIKALFEPILKADFQMMEAAQINGMLGDKKIDVALTVLLGREDKLAGDASTWHLYVEKEPAVHYFNGGHFFFLRNAREVVNTITNALQHDQ